MNERSRERPSAKSVRDPTDDSHLLPGGPSADDWRIRGQSSAEIEAFLRAYPSTVLIGASVLHGAGWITQIPARLTVAVLEPAPEEELEGFIVSGRPTEWYRLTQEARFGDPEDVPTFGIQSLPPAWALADLHEQNKLWCPDPDDLDIDDADLPAVHAAFEALGIPEPDWLVGLTTMPVYPC